MPRFYIEDKEVLCIYKRNLTRREMRYWRRFGRKLGYKIRVRKHQKN